MRRMDIDELLNGIIQDAARAMRKAQFEEQISRIHARIHAIERRIHEHWWETCCSEVERAMARREREREDEGETAMTRAAATPVRSPPRALRARRLRSIMFESMR